MQPLVWVVRFLIVIVLIWFAVKNAQTVTLNGFPGQTLDAPLVFVLLVVFVAGVVIGLLAWIPTVVRQRREIGKLKRSAAQMAAMPAPPDSTSPRLSVPPPDSHGV